MNAKISLFVICVEAIMYLLLYNMNDCTFNLAILKSSLTKVQWLFQWTVEKYKRLKGDNKIHRLYTNNKIIRLKLAENGSVKTITHINDLKDVFPDTDVDN